MNYVDGYLEGQAEFMADPRMECVGKNMPFDGSRLIFGGFDMIVNA